MGIYSHWWLDDNLPFSEVYFRVVVHRQLDKWLSCWGKRQISDAVFIRSYGAIFCCKAFLFAARLLNEPAAKALYRLQMVKTGVITKHKCGDFLTYNWHSICRCVCFIMLHSFDPSNSGRLLVCIPRQMDPKAPSSWKSQAPRIGWREILQEILFELG